LLAAAADGSGTDPATTEPAEKKICKRIAASGTLAGYQRVCRTRSEWQQLANRERDQQAPGAKPADREGEPGTRIERD
jgi:hypothetical protein